MFEALISKYMISGLEVSQDDSSPWSQQLELEKELQIC